MFNTYCYCLTPKGREMTASTKGTLLVKCDRINDRIDEFTKHFLNLEQNKKSDTITKEYFMEFVLSMHVIVTSELNEKGVERKWKA